MELRIVVVLGAMTTKPAGRGHVRAGADQYSAISTLTLIRARSGSFGPSGNQAR
jgi:hypothetical protein